MGQVRVIPASKNLHTTQDLNHPAKRRTAAYARVSTDSEEQLTSYEAQVDYYSKYIQDRADWEFVGIYTDEGISAVSMKRREGFKRMIEDSLSGKIDLIVTKSVSRFARNTVDSLTTVRQLKEKGVEVYFEKENIFTFDSKGELLITILSSLAQEESHNISQNVTWGHRKRFADGKLLMAYKQFLGYEKGEDGLPKIVESEAKTVQLIYRLFTEGMTASAIAKHMAKLNILSPGGKPTWQVATVESILTNEKYKGDALLQKRFTVDFLSKKIKDNEGEVPQYYVQNSHPAIIDPDEFDAVQVEYQRRKSLGRPNACQSPLSAKLICGDCGGYFGSKVWNSNSKYRRRIWRCNEKYKGGTKCTTPHVTEEEVMEKFVDAFNSIMIYRDELIANCRLAQQVLCDCTGIDTELENLHREIEVITELSRKAISENAHGGLTAEEFNERYSGYQQRYHTAMEQITRIDEQKSEKQHKRIVLDIFIKNLALKKHALDSFNNKIWMATIDRVLVSKTGQLTFRFKDGTEISR